MGEKKETCIWFGTCGEDCPIYCPDYTPMDEDLINETYYESDLEERAAVYRLTTEEFDDVEKK